MQPLISTNHNILFYEIYQHPYMKYIKTEEIVSEKSNVQECVCACVYAMNTYVYVCVCVYKEAQIVRSLERGTQTYSGKLKIFFLKEIIGKRKPK